MDTYCVLPWIHLATHPQGKVSLCCRVDFTNGRGMSFDGQADGEHSFKNLNTDKIAQIINSESFRNTRLQMLSGEKPLACMGCYKEESLGLVSKRLRENKVFDIDVGDLRILTAPSGEIQPNIKYAELRLGNLCNLKCRTCNPDSSSKWKRDYEGLQTELAFVRKYDLAENFNWAESDKFWQDFGENSKHLTQIYINGGEPTLIEQHLLFLSKLIELKLSKKIDLKYNINVTHLPRGIFDIWNEFKSVRVGASIDDLGDRNSYIRHGADWSVVTENLFRVRDAGFEVTVEQTVSVYNVFYLNEMEIFCKENNLGYGLNFVVDPAFLSIGCLPPQIKKAVGTKLSGCLSEYWMREVNAHLVFGFREDLWMQFVKYTSFLDRVRKENFSATFPEWSKLLKLEGISLEKL